MIREIAHIILTMPSEISQSSKGVALVTGSARGIGRAIALRLADDGFDVAVNDVLASRDDLEALRTKILDKGRKSHVVPADVSVEEEVKEMVSITVAELGGLDVVCAVQPARSICCERDTDDFGMIPCRWWQTPGC